MCFKRMGEFSADSRQVEEGTKHVVYVYTKNPVPVEKKGNVDGIRSRRWFLKNK